MSEEAIKAYRDCFKDVYKEIYKIWDFDKHFNTETNSYPVNLNHKWDEGWEAPEEHYEQPFKDYFIETKKYLLNELEKNDNMSVQIVERMANGYGRYVSHQEKDPGISICDKMLLNVSTEILLKMDAGPMSAHLEKIIEDMLKQPFIENEFKPQIDEVFKFIDKPHSQTLLDICKKVLLGAYQDTIEYPSEWTEMYEVKEEGGSSIHALTSVFSLYLNICLRNMMESLIKAGQFTYEEFKKSTEVFENLAGAGLDLDEEYGSHETLLKYFNMMNYEMLDTNDPNLDRYFSRYESVSGYEYLIKGCHLLEQTKQKINSENRKLFDIRFLYEDEDKVYKELLQFKPDTLIKVLPFAGAAQFAVARAIESQTEMKGVERLCVNLNDLFKDFACEDYVDRYKEVEATSPDPSKGIIDILDWRQVFDDLGEKGSRQIIKEFNKNKDVKSVYKLLLYPEIMLGENEKTIQKRIKSRNQIAIRSYGLWPIDKKKDRKKQLSERFAFYENFLKESQKYGQQRRTNEAAACKAGLENLARNFGYEDAARMELAIMADAAQEIPKPFSDKTYAISVDNGSLVCELVIEKSGKRIKSIPAALKKNKQVVALKDFVSEQKKMFTRYRRTLENMCVNREQLSVADIKDISRMNCVGQMLKRLVLYTDTETFVTYDLDTQSFFDISLKKAKAFKSCTIAHPQDFYKHKLLSQWQQEIVKREIIQPFKQVFRELYVATPAELKTKNQSMRFANHCLNSRQFSALLSNRGWTVKTGYDWCILKLLPAWGFQVELELGGDIGHYLTELETATTGPLTFSKYPSSGDREKDTLLIKDVPAQAFSEIMRDMDLFCSVAHTTEEDVYYTFERNSSNTELAKTILENLGIEGIGFDGNFVKVSGSLANYRVNLNSGAVHIDPGSHVCIVPDRSAAKYKPDYLPFIDKEDPTLSIVISKVILLYNDKKIKDAVILDQIKASQGA